MNWPGFTCAHSQLGLSDNVQIILLMIFVVCTNDSCLMFFRFTLYVVMIHTLVLETPYRVMVTYCCIQMETHYGTDTCSDRTLLMHTGDCGLETKNWPLCRPTSSICLPTFGMYPCPQQMCTCCCWDKCEWHLCLLLKICICVHCFFVAMHYWPVKYVERCVRYKSVLSPDPNLYG